MKQFAEKHILYFLFFISTPLVGQLNYHDSIQQLRDSKQEELLNSSNQLLNETEINKIERLDYYPIDSSKKQIDIYLTKGFKKNETFIEYTGGSSASSIPCLYTYLDY